VETVIGHPKDRIGLHRFARRRLTTVTAELHPAIRNSHDAPARLGGRLAYGDLAVSLQDVVAEDRG
jgi:hypothetical protein